MILSKQELAIIQDTRESLLRAKGDSDGWCAYCSWLLKLLLGRGEVTQGAVVAGKPTSYQLKGHWWLEIDTKAGPYVIDITGDQFNDKQVKVTQFENWGGSVVGRFSYVENEVYLPDIVTNFRSNLKVYHLRKREIFNDFTDEWIASVRRGNYWQSSDLFSFYLEMNAKYPRTEISRWLKGLEIY
jgi:hypothetical protein